MAEADATSRIRVELDNSQTLAANEQIKKTTQDTEKAVVQSLDKVEKAYQELGKTSKASTDTAAAATKKLSGAVTELAKKDRQLAVATTSGSEKRLTIEKESEAKAASEADKRITKQFRTDENLREDLEKRRRRRFEKIETAEKKAADTAAKRAEKEAKFAASQASPWYSLGWEAKRARMPASALLFGDINQQLARYNVMAASRPGLSPSQVWQQQMNAAIAASNAQLPFARMPAVSGGTAAGAGGGGFFGRGGLGRRLLGGGGGGVVGGFASGLLGGMGIGLGGYAVARAGGALLDATRTAVAYNRQRVAAENLAGSQSQLNRLLNAYGEASGGAIDKVTTLGNVTRLLATGFAKSVPDVERFVKATRGASIALGKPQDYVIQETQLAISNTSVKRLDQIGLGIVEVQQRIKALRKENVGWTREQAFQQAVLGLMEEKYGKLTDSLEGQKTGVELLAAAWSDFTLTVGQEAQGPINATAKAIAHLTRQIQENRKAAQEAMRTGEVASGIRLSAEERAVVEARRRGVDVEGAVSLQVQKDIWRRQANNRAGSNAFWGMFGYSAPNLPVPPSMSPLPRIGAGIEVPQIPGPLDKYGDQADFIRDAWKQSQQIERDAQKARLRATAEYEQQRTEVIRNYEKQIAREEEDFQRSRARGLRDYERSIVELMRDAQERDAEMRSDYEDRIAEMADDNQKRVADIEEKYQKDREKAAKDHRDKMLEAAGQLDAIAVLAERKRWKRENEEREAAHKDALEEAADTLKEQQDDARKAYEERLDDARKADAKRLEDMRADRARQLADEDEDRALRKSRAEEDHQDQLDEMARQHDLKMAEIAQDAQDSKDALDQLIQDNEDLMAGRIDAWVERNQKRDEAIEKWIDGILERFEKAIEAENKLRERAENPRHVGGGMTPFANGGPVHQTGPAMLHAGEFVLSRDMLAAVNNNSSYNSRSITVQSGAIQIQTTPGSEYMVADLLEERLIKLLGVV